MFWSLIYLVPKNLLSRVAGKIVRVRWPQPIRTKVILWFANRYKINLQEAERPVSDYLSIQDLFTRRLKANLRPVANSEVVHPVDGALTVFAKIHAGQLVQAKGWTYSLEEFLGEKSLEAYEGGHQLTYYLCPTDYHRVHSPVAGEIKKVRYIPGQLWPVNQWSVLNVRRLFARNERVVIWIQTKYGDVALVMVGATNVGQMTLSFDPTLITNVGQPVATKLYDVNPRIECGSELGIFNMGSTVIMVYPPQFPIQFDWRVPRAVQLGQGN